jgi:ferredoxin-thioredoxin reductase catalytic subunit/rubredoxin
MSRRDELKKEIEKTIKNRGYYLNPDDDFTLNLIDSLITNEDRYGYQFCPCRLASGDKNSDMDLICPCDYRDDDISEYGTCYCGLYVSEEVYNGEKEVQPIPERRNTGIDESDSNTNKLELSYPVYRCKVCGYLCARNTPPNKCPICGVDKERFEKFM